MHSCHLNNHHQVALLPFAFDADAATYAVGARQVFVRVIHIGDAGKYVWPHGGDAGARLIDMQREGFACGGEPAVFMPQLLITMEPLFVVIDNLERAGDHVAFVQFAHIADVMFGDVGGATGLVTVIRSKAKFGIHLIRALIHQDRIIGHVEVPIIVDPFGFHDHRF